MGHPHLFELQCFHRQRVIQVCLSIEFGSLYDYLTRYIHYHPDHFMGYIRQLHLKVYLKGERAPVKLYTILLLV